MAEIPRNYQRVDAKHYSMMVLLLFYHYRAGKRYAPSLGQANQIHPYLFRMHIRAIIKSLNRYCRLHCYWIKDCEKVLIGSILVNSNQRHVSGPMVAGLHTIPAEHTT